MRPLPATWEEGKMSAHKGSSLPVMSSQEPSRHHQAVAWLWELRSLMAKCPLVRQRWDRSSAAPRALLEQVLLMQLNWGGKTQKTTQVFLACVFFFFFWLLPLLGAVLRPVLASWIPQMNIFPALSWTSVKGKEYARGSCQSHASREWVYLYVTRSRHRSPSQHTLLFQR